MSSNPNKRIIIAGGVAGGMSCATRLRRLSEHTPITVLERGPYISYANCGIPYALSGVIPTDDALHVQTPEKITAWFNVDVKTNTELVSIDRENKTVLVHDRISGQKDIMPYDKLVLALGAEPITPRGIEGGDGEHVFHLTTLADLDSIREYIKAKGAKTVAVIGGAFIGLEAAENLRLLGLQVSVIERLSHIFPPADADMVYPLEKELNAHGVNLVTDAAVTKILPNEVELASGQQVPAELVIMAAGVRARIDIPKAAGLQAGKTGLAVNEFMQTSDPDVYAVGDMVETPNMLLRGLDHPDKNKMLALAGPANRQGRLAADHICGKETRYRGNIGTWVCKVFGKAIGMTGLSSHQLDEIMGVEKGRHDWVTVHPVNHAGYYPGSCRLTVKIHFDLKNGKLLGGQVTGPENAGVDKQTDVLAVALTAGMTVEDLEHLELAYAPPFGSAKDAVNMAGFVAGNVLRGDVEIVHAADFAFETSKGRRKSLQDFFLLDVRSPKEFANGHIDGAVNIPLGDLRQRLDEVPKNKPILSYCQVGYRGYLGYRILKQDGYDAVNLDGGYRAVFEGGFDDGLKPVIKRWAPN
ncbi:putative NADH oxidase [Cercophora samala]|uniref:NADH oxidase n=1 Tax=Cercophora samala TaxID=330535 RepID=A0AA39Z9N6_9PEZI|nr:putative NADH oxidase [Cercophora samala]